MLVRNSDIFFVNDFFLSVIRCVYITQWEERRNIFGKRGKKLGDFEWVGPELR
jgi:hypothetical protein